MAFVADELGVESCTIAAAAPRDLAAARPASRSSGSSRLIRRERPHDPAHAHGEGGRGRPRRRAARGRRAAADHRAHVPRPRAARLLRPAAHAVLPRARALLARHDDALDRGRAREVRDDLVALGVAPRGEVHRHPARDRARRARRADGDGARRDPPAVRASRTTRFVVGWIGRMTGDQAHRRRPARVQAACVDRGVDATLCLVGDGPDRDALEQRAHELGIVRDMPLPRLPGDVAPLLRAVRRASAAVGERGDAGRRDRGARRAGARSSRRASAACRRRRRRRGRLPRRRRRHRTARGPRSRGSRATRSCARGWATRAASASLPRYASSGSSTTSTSSTASCSRSDGRQPLAAICMKALNARLLLAARRS